VHVPYRGETLVYNDMLGERVDVFFGNISGALALSSRTKSGAGAR
jgi:tripartite-type tricarboxylate transporter receptor subunit TctC